MPVLPRLARRLPLRGGVALVVALAVALVGYVGWVRWTPRLDVAELRALRARLHASVTDWVERGTLARTDGHTYTVDLAQLLEHAARSGDAALYGKLRAIAAPLVLERPDDPYTRGFVAWRDGAPDASGTTEALRLARALWLGAERFGEAGDRALAREVLEGYARHAATDHGVWLVRNYFNLGTRAFANDSFLVDYDPDLLAGVPGFEEVAARSLELVRRARAPSGLLYAMVQPDLRTLLPRLDLVVFSPNDVVQLNNACTVAETVVRGAPEVARGVLDFALSRPAPLRRYFVGRTGAPFNEVPAEITSLTCLARLAARLGDADAAHHLGERAVWHWRTFADGLQPPRAYTASEVLLTLDHLIPLLAPGS